MNCPVCQVQLGIERRADEVAVKYDLKDWSMRCPFRDRGDVLLCSNLLPVILELLTEKLLTGSKVTSLDTGKPREG
jgi:hypothetical protein